MNYNNAVKYGAAEDINAEAHLRHLAGGSRIHPSYENVRDEDGAKYDPINDGELYPSDLYEERQGTGGEYDTRDAAAKALHEAGRHEEANLLSSRHPIQILINGRSITNSGWASDNPGSVTVAADYPSHQEGYPVVYYDHGDTLCSDCVNREVENDPTGDVYNSDVYWEGPPVTCDNCGQEIHSAYGDPNADSDNDNDGQ